MVAWTLSQSLWNDRCWNWAAWASVPSCSAATPTAASWARLPAFSWAGEEGRGGDKDSSDSASTFRWQKLTGRQQARESGKCSLQISDPSSRGGYRRRVVGLTEEDPIQSSTSLTVKPKFTMSSQKSTPSPNTYAPSFCPHPHHLSPHCAPATPASLLLITPAGPSFLRV